MLVCSNLNSSISDDTYSGFVPVRKIWKVMEFDNLDSIPGLESHGIFFKDTESHII